MEFMKWHGLGNDFILLDCRNNDYSVTAKSAIAMCDRHTGIGADGVVQILPPHSPTARAEMRIYNADGTIAEMCGNALRCVATVLSAQDGIRGPIGIDTPAGQLEANVTTDEAGNPSVRVNMGIPGLLRKDIGMRENPEASAQEIDVSVGDVSMVFTGVSMGNPHVVTFVENVMEIPLEVWGSQVAANELFSAQTNVEFVEASADALRMRVWERGVGVTRACGTGACAAMVAAVQNGRAGRRAEVILDGGSLWIEWDGTGTPVYMTGPAVHVYNGVIE